ncbi:hypothetical protein BCR41DRAFT_151257 [Lobosporangium transversale]|uniref:BZIP domain-containing protein n=1 Tax=Lobosporangium transversale TaxID=64571 RepID=A0A1Y2GY20_9FUNG|nr:hypothetical protein BCR41DRAFT_151257 [Lobosporangium transversale]ORZ27200.1 hypothetical protein BCR41DRAFT_151257 [Lobosporangium transversale]|eukprot:XP_021884927.1 hypothetical protein BCR41DRAFT_151257 [Lobosporangium transversale]
MSSSSDTSTPNVENMSNAELFQYLFKAELDAGDLPAALTEVLFEQDLSTETVFDTYSPSSSAASTVAHSPYTSASPTASSPHGGSPVASILSYDSPSPYRCVTSSPQQLNFEQEQEQQPAQQPEQQLEYQIQMFQPLQQYPELSITSTTSLTYPTRLPSNMFSYRQISPDMPPSMPSPSTPAGFADTSEDQFYSLTQEATARASSSTMSTEEMTLWLQRFQQVQRLQHPSTSDTQNHYGDAECSAPPSSPTIKNSSLSNLLSLKREKHTFYPSPPMKDDVDMDSDSDHGSNQNNDSQSDPLKPSPSELKKMTSKERRQLRNKLSARNFRVRRKGNITMPELSSVSK